MPNANKRKGDVFERAVRDYLAQFGLTVERTRAGYQRDAGDLHVLHRGRVLATIQCKDTTAYQWKEWWGQLSAQQYEAKADLAILVKKQRGVAHPGHAIAAMQLQGIAALLERIIELEDALHWHEEYLRAALSLKPGEPLPTPTTRQEGDHP